MKTKRYYYILITLFFVGVISFILSCDKEKDISLPPTNRLTIETDSIKSVLYHTAIAFGSIGEFKNITIQQYGHCWDTIEIPTIESNKTLFSNLTSHSTFNSNLADLKPAKKYYVRSYAKTNSLTAYSEISSFTTKSLEPPTLTSDSIKDITSTTANIWGAIKLDGGTTISARGVCWGTTINPTLTSQHAEANGLTNVFSTPITGLTRKTLYHVRVYATNQSGTAYGSDIVFTTEAELPIITSVNATEITYNSAKSGGNISSDGSEVITSRGVCWSTSQNPTIVNSHTSDGVSTGSFTSSLTGLQFATKYYARAYAINSVGTSYGNQIEFTTPATIPTLTTNSVSAITVSSATCGGNIASDGGSAIISRGVCWSTSPNPTVSDNITQNGSGTGLFTSYLTGLSASTTYYVRAYAINNIGTGYGLEQIINTPDGIAILTTKSVTYIASTTATSGGVITSDGGATITDRGVVWSTSPNPTIDLTTKTSDGTGTGSFNSNITNLTFNTTYYVRAYTTNSVGTFYGNEIQYEHKLTIGMSYAGGIIFYINGTGQHGLVCATSDQSIETIWGCDGTDVSGASGTAVGTGSQNTIDIVNGGCFGAALICYNLDLNGYSDWFLPSKDELNLMYANLKSNNLADFKEFAYWSSSEYSSSGAWYQNFANGSQSTINKGNASYGPFLHVRAIRAF